MIVLLGFYIIQIIFVLFLFLTTEAFQSKEEFFLAMNPFFLLILLFKKLTTLK